MESIIAVAEEGIDKALEFYKQNSVTLDYRPKLKYIDLVHPVRPDALAGINEEFEVTNRYIDFFYKNFGKIAWKELYALDISDSALVEVTRITKARLPEISSAFDELMRGADIVIFQPYKGCDSRVKEAIMAHEIWHLIEKERKLLQENPFIMEGTATYAMMKFTGDSCNTPLEDCDDLFMMMYLGGANIVQNHVENRENPYLAILDRNLRTRIEQELLGRVKPVLVDKIKKMLESEEMQKAEAKMLRQIPELENLEGNLTAENLVKAYRQMGAINLADELQRQKLDTLLSWFKKFGF